MSQKKSYEDICPIARLRVRFSVLDFQYSVITCMPGRGSLYFLPHGQAAGADPLVVPAPALGLSPGQATKVESPIIITCPC